MGGDVDLVDVLSSSSSSSSEVGEGDRDNGGVEVDAVMSLPEEDMDDMDDRWLSEGASLRSKLVN